MDEITKLKAEIYDLGKQQQQLMLQGQQIQAGIQQCEREALKLEARIEQLTEQQKALNTATKLL